MRIRRGPATVIDDEKGCGTVNIAGAIADVATCGGFFAITVGGNPAGWVPVHRCYRAGCADLVEATATRCETTDLRVGASLVQFSHASRLWSPVLATALAHGVVPDLADIQRRDTGTELRLPAPVGRQLDDGRPLAQQLYRLVIEDHLEPLVAGLRVKAAPRLLYGNAAAALVGAANQLAAARPQLRSAAISVTESLLAMGDLAGTGALTALQFQRRSCCLYYRVPAGSYCGDCALAGRGRGQ